MIVKRSHLVVAGSGLVIAWLAAWFFVLPGVVSDAYAGRSFVPLLNRAISGQATHSLEYYQSLARKAVVFATVAAFALVAAGMAAWHWRRSIAAWWTRLLTVPASLTVTGVIATGGWIGFVSGLLEGVIVYGRLLILGEPAESPSVHVLWMAPFSATLMGTLAGVLLAILLRAWRRVSPALPVMIFSALGVYALVRASHFGIHPYAMYILSLGAAIQLSRLATARHAGFATLRRRSVPWMGAMTAGTFLVIMASDAMRSRRGDVRGAGDAGTPNVLLLILDTVRAQDLGLYGYNRETSPEIERFAATGVTFDRAISTAPWTLPSHASMFTGLSPDLLSTDFRVPLDTAPPTLAEVLQARGYATGGFVANMVYTTRSSGLDRGFTVYRDHPFSLGLFLGSSLWARTAANFAMPFLDIHGHLVRKAAEDVNRQFLSWMPSDGTPFFAFLNYMDAHTPYKLESPYDRKFRDPPPRYWKFKGWNRARNDEELQEFRDSYNSAIAYIDAEIGTLLKELERRGVLSQTVVIIASDHGELFGEHGGITRHANSLYLPALHVPLVVSFPDRVPAGVRVSAPVSTQDIPATVLDLLGDSVTTALPGRSLSRGWTGQLDSTEPLYSELTFNENSNDGDPIEKGPMQSLVTGRWHYIRNGDGSEELYDFIDDPDELMNRANAPESSVLDSLRQLLADRIKVPGARSRVEASEGSPRQP